jgi:hypothetical protein
MSFACHLDEGSGFFSASSYFNPLDTEICPLEDTIPEAVKIERKKNNGITYLPGEKLLIKLSKQRKKQKKTKSNLDVERVTASLGRILPL